MEIDRNTYSENTKVFAKLMNLISSSGGDIVFMPMKSHCQGLLVTQEVKYSAEEMEKLIHLAEKNNIRVRFTPFMTDEGEMKYWNNEIRVGIRAEMGFDEYIYNLAHELAHYFLHYDKGDTITSDKHKEYEEQADRGAKMLLAALTISGR